MVPPVPNRKLSQLGIETLHVWFFSCTCLLFYKRDMLPPVNRHLVCLSYRVWVSWRLIQLISRGHFLTLVSLYNFLSIGYFRQVRRGIFLTNDLVNVPHERVAPRLRWIWSVPLIARSRLPGKPQHSRPLFNLVVTGCIPTTVCGNWWLVN